MDDRRLDNHNNSEKCRNNNKQLKTSIQYKIFNRRDLIRNQSNFSKRFQNNFDRRNHFENENPSMRFRKQPLEIQENEEHQGIPENIPDDFLLQTPSH